MNRYKCIIFDFDGTLADTNIGIVRTFQETFRKVGIPVPSAQKITSTIGLTLRDGFKTACPEISDRDAECCVEIYRSLFPQIAYPVIEAFPGVIETLEEIRSRGIIMAVATSRSHKSLEHLAAQTGVTPYMSALFGAEDVVNHKPAPDLVNLILNEFGLKASDTLVVGDATFDMLMGQGAGCPVCGVSWGNQSAETLATVSPDHIIGSIPELLDLI